MRIDYLTDANTDLTNARMIRIREFAGDDVQELMNAIDRHILSPGGKGFFQFTELSCFLQESYDLCFKLGEKDLEIDGAKDSVFTLEITHESFSEMKLDLAPFVQNNCGFQFLVDPIGDGVELLISWGGAW